MRAFNGCTQRAYAGLLLAMFAISPSGEAFAYCTSAGTNTGYEWIDHISVGGFSNTSGVSSGYADFTGQLIDLVAGTNSLTLTPGFNGSSYTENWKIWIDFNNDAAFTADESVFSGASRSTLSGSITIPDTATSGTTRMRVTMQYSGTPQPCGSFTYGEVEDYTVILNTTDTTSPTVISRSPDTAAVDVALNSVVTVNFSEDIDPLTVNNSSISLNYAGLYVTGIVNASGNIATFTTDQPLEYSTQYTATVYSGLLDLSGNPLLQDEVWSFTTAAPDIIAPTISQASPQDGAVDVSNNFVVSALFSEPMNPTTINASTFTINDGTSNISGSVVLNGNGKTAQFYPDQPFDYSTTYTATIAASAQDLAGNALQSDYSWSFTSREFQLDYCASYASNYSYMWIAAVKVGSFTYHSPSQPGTGYSDHTGTIFDLSRYFPRSIALTPGYSGYAYTTYWRVFIDWNKDGAFTADETAFSGSGDAEVNGSITVPDYAAAGNTRMRVSIQYATYPGSCGSLSYGEVEDYRVSIPDPIADTTPPEVSAVSPLDSAQNVTINSAVTVNFSEEIDASTLSDTSLVLSGGTTPVNVSVIYNSQSKQAVFTPTSNLQYDTFYIATLHNSISDVSGNPMLNDFAWSFTTAPEQGPTYTVSGAVQDQGAGVAGIAINVTGDASLTTTTDANGNYSLTPLPPGNYTITPNKGGYSFAPESLGLTVVDSDVSAVDFAASILANALVNGDFEQGNFNGFNSYTTSNGTVNKGIYLFDTDNDGVNSLAAQFSVGTDSISSVGIQQGGGIYQAVGLSDGDLSVTVDIAATAVSNNAAGGLVQLLFDGAAMDSHDFGSITAGTNEYATLSFNVASVAAGNHEIRIQVTRAYMPTNTSNYVDNIVLTGSSTQ